jgi:hypothetical protein
VQTMWDGRLLSEASPLESASREGGAVICLAATIGGSLARAALQFVMIMFHPLPHLSLASHPHPLTYVTLGLPRINAHQAFANALNWSIWNENPEVRGGGSVRMTYDDRPASGLSLALGFDQRVGSCM